jgi:hypothetical protein
VLRVVPRQHPFISHQLEPLARLKTATLHTGLRPKYDDHTSSAIAADLHKQTTITLPTERQHCRAVQRNMGYARSRQKGGSEGGKREGEQDGVSADESSRVCDMAVSMYDG